MPLPKPCQRCDFKFMPKSKQSKFCDVCRYDLKKARWKRYNPKCKHCKKEFYPLTRTIKVCDRCQIKSLRPYWRNKLLKNE